MTNKFSMLVKRVVAATMAVAMLLTSATLPTFAKTEDAGTTYIVPISDLKSGAPLPPVQAAFKKGFGTEVEITEYKDGTKTAILKTENMQINLFGSMFYANILKVRNGENVADVLGTTKRLYSGSEKNEEVEVPIAFEVVLPSKNAKGEYELEITVDYMNAMYGDVNVDNWMDVKLVLDEENKSELVADYTKVDEALAAIPADLSGYTKESVAALNAAKDAVVRDLNAAEQARVDEMAANITNAIKGLEKAKAIKFEDNAIYEVEVALWNASKDQPSMAASSVKEMAKIYVKDGVATMHIYTQPMSLGTITASLEELRVYELDGKTFKNGVVEAKSADGKPVEFSFVLPHTNEFIQTEVNPHVAMMGNQFIKARLHVNYASLKKVGTIKPEVPAKPATKPEAKPEVKPSVDNENPHTADSSSVIMFTMMAMVSAAGVAFLGKKRKATKA